MLALPTLAHAMEILRWERIPLAIPLTVGQERIVFVDRNVRGWRSSGSAGQALRVQSTGGAPYLLANEPIPPARLRLQDASQWRADTIDIAATEAAADQQPRASRSGSSPASPWLRTMASPGEAQPSAAAKQTKQAEAPKAVPRRNARPVVPTRYAGSDALCPASHGETGGWRRSGCASSDSST
ncbi:DUF3438 family protein [Pseudomonas aeruginosa]|nr:DUF3438 family protein [Pseudomonas aeruginosa]